MFNNRGESDDFVSACLAGFDVKYNGSHNLNEKIKKWFNEKKAIPICPEVLGGLSIPREPAEIVGGRGGRCIRWTCKSDHK